MHLHLNTVELGKYDFQYESDALKLVGTMDVCNPMAQAKDSYTSSINKHLEPRKNKPITMNTAERRYVLLTPVKNEESTIGTTIDSVVNQSLLPTEWIIVSDGSTDQTDPMVEAAARMHPWIRLIQLPIRTTRSFSAVVQATETGVKALKSKEYEYLGLLDADVRFDPNYFERLIELFEQNPSLGLAGGMVVDVGTSKNHRPRNVQDVPGAVQFFRRTCFDSLDGLVAIPEGGWDALTCAKARMNGFETKLLPELVVDHLKPRNISEGGAIRRKYQLGVRDYALAYHPVFEFVKCVGRTAESPFLFAAIARFFGFCMASFRRKPRLFAPDLVKFIRQEQVRRLKRILGLH
jgi:poly-beta-1,6-N-acetyl-D-glucosamine synthase